MSLRVALLTRLRRLICRCPDMPVIENTGYTVGFASSGGSWGVEHPVGQLDQTLAPPVMQVHVGGNDDAGAALYDALSAAELDRRHLRLVHDADVPVQQDDDAS